ncbi:MAG: hypothetical protein ACKV19_20740 [Verrucomicrobiales bacterium]
MAVHPHPQTTRELIRKTGRQEGMGTRSSVCRLIRDLDEPFDPHTDATHTTEFREQPADLNAEVYGTIQKKLSQGFEPLCFLESTNQCKPGIVRAHAIQEALIREIAVKGHVLQFNVYQRHSPQQEHRNWPTLVGVDCATTFTGFCSYHDNQIFLPIENSPFTPTPESCFLYAYRALCARLYDAKYKFELVNAQAAALRASGQTNLHLIERNIAANALDTEEILTIKTKWDGCLTSRDFSSFDHLALSCPYTPSIIGTSFFAPRKNFDYTFAQDTKSKRFLKWVSMSVLPLKDGRGLVLISSEKKNPVWVRFTESLLTYPPEKRTMAVVNYMVPYFGTQLIIGPSWWGQLPNESQEAIVTPGTHVTTHATSKGCATGDHCYPSTGHRQQHPPPGTDHNWNAR